jgi:hypothetical protein
MSITYQQAKRIRNTGLMSLFADQLMYEKKISTAIKKTISLKTRASVKGITQKFDPLNIAKMLTFGSSLGPALLGHMMGRDAKDIQYFTGRLKPIREKTGDKLTKLGPVDKTQEMSGLSETLKKMHNLLSGVHEDNLKRLELAKNLEEEHQLEEERRHKELLTVLSGGKIKKSGKGNRFDSLTDWLKNFMANFDFKKIISDIFGGMKVFGSLLRFLGSSLFRFVLMNPAVLTVATILGLAELLAWSVKRIANRNVISPEEAAAALENASERDIVKLGGEEALKDIIINGPARAAEILERNDEVEMNQAGGKEFLEKVVKQKNVKIPKDMRFKNETITKVVPRPDTSEGKNLRSAEEWDRTWGGKFDPVTGLKIDENTYYANENAKLQRQNATATGVPVGNNDNVGSRLNAAANENLNNRISVGKLNKSQPEQNTQTNVNKKIETTPVKKQIPSVRNQEDSFLRMIFDSTRVV